MPLLNGIDYVDTVIPRPEFLDPVLLQRCQLASRRLEFNEEHFTVTRVECHVRPPRRHVEPAHFVLLVKQPDAPRIAQDVVLNLSLRASHRERFKTTSWA